MLATVKPPLRLPFVTQENGVDSYWEPDRRGDYGEACARGQDYADALLELIRDEEEPVLFGFVLQAIVAKGVYDAVEIGFFTRLGSELL